MLIFIALGLLWVAGCVRLVRGRGRYAGSARAITVALFAVAFAGTVDVSDVSDLLDRTFGWTNTGPALKSVGIVVAAAANQVMLLYLLRAKSFRQRDVSIRWGVAGAVSGLSLGLFALAGRLPVDHDFTRDLGPHPWAAASRLVVEAFAAYVLLQVALLCRRELTRTPLGRGLALLGAGAATLVVHAASRIAYILGGALKLNLPASLYSVGSILAAFGLALVALGAMITPAEQLVRARLMLRHLAPLLQDTARIAPPSVFAEVVPRGATASVDHRVAQVQDALYLAAVDRGSDAANDELEAPQARAARIARWVQDQTDRTIGPGDLAAPPGVSDQTWVKLIATEHRRMHDGQARQAS